MAATKTALKAAKAALDVSDHKEAVKQANVVIAADAQNYYGHVFLGRALEKLGQLDEAIPSYRAATRIKPDDELAWKGLCNIFEAQGARRVKDHIAASLELAKLLVQKDDIEQCQTVVDKLVAHAKAVGSRHDYTQALETLLPTSPIYDFLEGRIQRAALTFTRLAEIAEVDERERINREIGERRTRLGAKIGQVTSDVAREVYARSGLEALYQNVVDWTSDDEQRREYEEKLLQRAYDHLLVLPSGEKAEKRSQVVRLAHDMVIIKHPFPLAWRLELEWTDLEELSYLDLGILREYVEFFPDRGLANVIKAFLGVEAVQDGDQDGADADKEAQRAPKTRQLSAEDRLLLMTDGIEECKDSALAHRMVGDFYLALGEYESCVETSRQGLQCLRVESQQSGLRLQSNNDAMASNLATSLVYYQSPKNHPEAKALFDSILERTPTSTAALLGIGLIYEEETDFAKASDFLQRALQRDPNNVRIGTEAAWCQALTGQLVDGLEKLKAFEPDLKANDAQARALKAQTLYRIGRCTWDLRSDRDARKDRRGAYAYFLAAVRTNPEFAPAYHSLGIYYADYLRDRKRARQCFQKAFELSATEVDAAERLARHFADEGDWDIVELVAQRVVDSGVAKPSPGSKRKGISWPFAAVGIVQMNKLEYPRAVISFQSAIRISPNDYHAWVGLGESYHSSGRYNAAQRTLEHALSLSQQADASSTIKDASETWFALYMLANVHRELGDSVKAIDGYIRVLELRPDESGVTMALLQTWLEKATAELETGFFGQASMSAGRALHAARDMLHAQQHAESFNFWKCVADACAVYSHLPGRMRDFPKEDVLALLNPGEFDGSYELLADIDGISLSQLTTSTSDEPPNPIIPAILAHKRAITASTSDPHARSIAWYNLGWAYHRAYASASASSSASASASESASKPDSRHPHRHARAAIHALKRAIEYEAGNATFWLALGCAAAPLNAAVAQHALVRALHLDARSVRAWTALGALYLAHGDAELAHAAFARAQSTDPQHAPAWLGEGLVAARLGDKREALSHYTHGLEIGGGGGASLPVRALFVDAAFDALITGDGHTSTSSSSSLSSTTDLAGPLLALRQLLTLAPPLQKPAHAHLLALIDERLAPFTLIPLMLTHLHDAASAAEAAYESSESPASLRAFILSTAALARAHLVARDFSAASAAASTTLDLTAEPDDALGSADRMRVRLSARLTAALAAFHADGAAAGLASLDGSASRDADAEAEEDAALPALRAQLLWALATPASRTQALHVLRSASARHPRSADLHALLAVCAALQALSTSASASASATPTATVIADAPVPVHLRARLADALLLPSPAALPYADALAHIARAPHRAAGWTRLARATGDAHAEAMVGLTVCAGVGERERTRAGYEAEEDSDGGGEAETVARAWAGAGAAAPAAAQRAVVLAPWLAEGWGALGECCC